MSFEFAHLGYEYAVGASLVDEDNGGTVVPAVLDSGIHRRRPPHPALQVIDRWESRQDLRSCHLAPRSPQADFLFPLAASESFSRL